MTGITYKAGTCYLCRKPCDPKQYAHVECQGDYTEYEERNY